MKNRLFYIWIKGQRNSSEKLIEAAKRADAIFIYARMYGLKTFQCDGKLVR